MAQKFLAALLVVLVLGLAGLYVADRRLESRHLAQQAASRQYRQDISVTIIEGKRREEIAQQLQTAGICSAEDFLAASQGYEGYLFPDTYRFFPNTPADQVVKKLVDNYQVRTGDQPPTRNQLVLASIIEREAQNDQERSEIAGVYSNRLARGMKLEADPTTQYAKDSLAFAKQGFPYSFWGPITQQDYVSITSPYNTYLQSGLPPGPICNPGLPSIRAAENPDQSQYLYFVHRNGKLYLSQTLSEHIQQESL